jgi:hypothetical protein
MKYIPHTYRQADMNRLMWGMRLFHNLNTPLSGPSSLPPPPPTSFEYVRENTAAFLNNIAHQTTWFVGETAKTITACAISIPSGMMDGLNYAWQNGFPSQETVSNLLYKMASFFRAEQELTEVFNLLPNIHDVGTMARLTDHVEWIRALEELQGTDFLRKKETTPMAENGANFGPKEFLWMLPLAQRQEVYLNFINHYIDRKVQEENGWSGVTLDDKIANIDKDKTTINQTLSAILGITDQKYLNENDKSRVKGIRAAKESLKLYYQKNNKNFPYRITTSLAEDYARSLQYNTLRAHSSLATDPERLQGPLQYSPFKGALKLGVVDHALLAEMYPVAKEKKFENFLSVNNVRDRLETLSGAARNTARKDAETLKDSWNQLHPGIKLLVGAGLLYGFFNSKMVRGGVLGMSAVYLFQKLVMKQKDPIEGWAKLIRSPFDAIKEKNAKDIGQSVTPGAIEETTSRARLYVKFLEKFDYVNMERQAVGLALLSDMPMSTLARNFKMQQPAGESFYLNIEGMDTEMRESMKMRGWKGGYRDYFANSESRQQSSEALGYAFYVRAVADRGNWEDFMFIEKVRGGLMPGSSLSGLPSPYGNPDPFKNQRYASADPVKQRDMVDAQQRYIRLVAEGAALSEGDSRPLGEFVSSTMNLVPPMTRKIDIGGEPDRREASRGGYADKRDVNPGGTADRRDVDAGAEPDKKTAGTGGEPDKKSGDSGGEADRRNGDSGGDPDTRSGDAGGESDGRSTDAGDTPDTKSGDAGGTPDTKTSESGSESKKAAPASSKESTTKDEDIGGIPDRH